MSNIDKALDKIRSKFGNNCIRSLNDKLEKIDSISTGSLSLDNAIGIGGIPKGRIIEIYGAESTGKSTLCAHIVKEAQLKNETCVYIDMEHAVDFNYFEKIGIDMFNDNFLISQPDTAEEALEIAEILIENNSAAVIIIDSVAALVPAAEAESDLTDNNMALLARLLSKFCRRITPIIGKSNSCLIFINQIRENIATMGYGPKTSTPGGKALKFYSAVRIELAKISQIKDGESIIGNKIKAKLVKNKVGRPFTEVQYDLIFGEGISKEREVIELGVQKGIIKKSGAWFSYEDEKLGQGLEKTRLKLIENKELFNEILNKVSE